MVDKQDLLLTPDEFANAEIEGNANVPAYGSGAAEHRYYAYRAVAQAQLAKVEPIIRKDERERIFEKLEGYPYSELKASGTGRDPSAVQREVRVPLLEWQALKKGEL